jgi:hypothetical protein
LRTSVRAAIARETEKLPVACNAQQSATPNVQPIAPGAVAGPAVAGTPGSDDCPGQLIGPGRQIVLQKAMQALQREWAPQGLEISLRVPENGNWDDPKPKEVGRWIIGFAEPRPSDFSDWSVCTTPQSGKQNTASPDAMRCSTTISGAQQKISAEVRPSEILNFDLVNGASQKLGTIRAFLSQQEWFTTAVVAFAGTNAEADDNASNLFCRRVINEIAGLDLSDFDARLVLWAVYKGMPVTFPNRFKTAADCKDSIGNQTAVPAAPIVATVPR